MIAAINPSAVAEDVTRHIGDHISSACMRYDPSATWSVPEAAASQIGLTARALAQYARDGLPVWDWTDHGCAADALLDVVAALYSRAADGALPAPALDDVGYWPNSDDAIGVVLLAAVARIKLDRHEPLRSEHLAILADLSPSQVRRLIASGEIVGDSGARGRGATASVEWSDARRWLRSRAVPGI